MNTDIEEIGKRIALKQQLIALTWHEITELRQQERESGNGPDGVR